MMTSNRALLDNAEVQKTWHPLRDEMLDSDLWTDDYANVLRALWK